MNKDADLHAALERLERKLSKLSPVKAIKLIDAEIISVVSPHHVPHYEVRKAAILRDSDNLNDAINLLKQSVLNYKSIDSARFFAGQYLLELGNYEEAIEQLTECIKLCGLSGELWYLDSSYLLRAYCAAKTNNAKLANDDLNRIDDDDAMSWIPVEPVVSKSSINFMLQKNSTMK